MRNEYLTSPAEPLLEVLFDEVFFLFEPYSMKVLPPFDIGDEGVQDDQVRMHQAL